MNTNDLSMVVAEVKNSLQKGNFSNIAVSKVFGELGISEAQSTKLKSLLGINIVSSKEILDPEEIKRQSRALRTVFTILLNLEEDINGDRNINAVIKFLEKYGSPLT
jgi:hypothetical protein